MKRSIGFKIAAVIILGLMSIFWLFISIPGIVQGTSRGILTLVSILISIGLAILAWKRPLLGGSLLSAFGIVLAIYFFMAMADLQSATPPLLFMCAPIAIAGLIFIEAAWSLKKS